MNYFLTSCAVSSAIGYIAARTGYMGKATMHLKDKYYQDSMNDMSNGVITYKNIKIKKYIFDSLVHYDKVDTCKLFDYEGIYCGTDVSTNKTYERYIRPVSVFYNGKEV